MCKDIHSQDVYKRQGVSCHKGCRKSEDLQNSYSFCHVASPFPLRLFVNNRDLKTCHCQVCLKCLVDLLKRELVCDQLRHRKSDCFCSLKEIKCCCIVSEVVYPGTNKVDLFGAEVEVRVNGCVSTVDEETKLAKTAAVADKFVDVGVCMRISSTLESEICKMSALSLFNSLSRCV